MEVDKLLSKNIVHPVYVRRVAPVAIVYSCKCNSFLLALQCSQHHVSRVNRVHVVWREGRILFRFVYWLGIHVLSDCDLLNYCVYNVFVSNRFVRLHTWQAQGSQPFYWVTTRCHNLSTFRKPLFNVVCVSK